MKNRSIPPRPRLRPVTLLLAGLAVVWLGGCGTLQGLKPESSFHPLGDIPLEDLLELLDRRYRQIDTVNALVRVETTAPEVRAKFHGLLFFRAPDSLRFKALDPFGRVVLDLIVRDDGISVDPPQRDGVRGGDELIRRVEERGPAGRREMAAVLGVPGGIARDPELVPALEKEREFYILYFFRLTGSTASLYRRLWLERVHFRVTRQEVFDPDGRRWMDVAFEDYAKVQGRWWPMKVRARFGDSHSISLGYSEVRVNPDLQTDVSMGSAVGSGRPATGEGKKENRGEE